LVYRTILAWTLVGTLILAVVLAMLVLSSWQSVSRLEPVGEHLGFYAELQEISAAAQDGLLQAADPGPELTRILAGAADRAERLTEQGGHLAERTPELLRQVARAFRDAPGDAGSIGQGVRALRQAMAGEVQGQQALLGELDAQNRRQLQAVVVIAAVLPLAALAFLWVFRRRVLAPLNDLSYLMGLMAQREYNLARIDQVDPLMRPLFERYNRMARRVRAVEQGHVKRETSLQRDVDSVSQAMLSQQMALARSDRLAALGEMAARVAHELRNPLSGVLVALSNLRRDIDSDDQDERLRMAINELQRIARSLSNLVDESRQEPEAPRRLRLSSLIEELARLVSYQLPPTTELAVDVPADLGWTVPEVELRNAIMNLVLNASQALGRRGGRISISARAEQEALYIEVCDDGPGFPEELLATGVHEYASWRPGGTGLGLATVRRFVRSHGGHLALVNRPEGGGCATIVLGEEGVNG
jgi:signal transduction histidine kinase